MNERIKELRKALGLTLEKFGGRLGVTKSAISSIENGRHGVTNQMLISIVREFNVSEQWLRTGEGDPFPDKATDDLITHIVSQADKDEFRMRFFLALGQMTDQEWEKLRLFVGKIS